MGSLFSGSGGGGEGAMEYLGIPAEHSKSQCSWKQVKVLSMIKPSDPGMTPGKPENILSIPLQGHDPRDRITA